jgi:predicted ATPase
MIMLQTLHILNFKSWKETGDLRLGKITGLFGTNSSGKSSILQFLLMLKQTVDSQDPATVLNFGGDEKQSYVDLGSFQDVSHVENGTPSPYLFWDMTWSSEGNGRSINVPGTGDAKIPICSLSFNANIRLTSAGPSVDVFSYDFDHDGAVYSFGMGVQGESRDTYHVDTQGYDLQRIQGPSWLVGPPLKCYGFPGEVIAHFQDARFLLELNTAFQNLFDRMYYLGPLREPPQRHYAWGGGVLSDMGRRGENVVPALIASRSFKPMRGRRVRKSMTVEQYVAYWLKELGLIQSFSIKEIAPGSNLFQVRVRQFENSPEVAITDVGFGVSQVLPVLALCYYVPEGSIVLFEQPEIHLHPSVEAGLADVFIDAVKTRNIQIILESHGEHLLTRLQRRMAEEEIDSSDVALYFCERGEKESTIRTLNLDEYGNITNWPKGFFGDEFGERSKAMDAMLRRRAA